MDVPWHMILFAKEGCENFIVAIINGFHNVQ